MKKFIGVVVAAAVLSGCAGWGVFKDCVTKAAPNEAAPVLATVVAIASQPAGYVTDLMALGKQVGPAVVDCIVEALIADTSNAKFKAMLTHLHEYLSARLAMGELTTECHAISL